jgi:hypothetical protein
MSRFSDNATRLIVAGAAVAMVLGVGACNRTSPENMDRRELVKTVIENGAMEVFRGPGTGTFVSGLAAMPETAKGLLIADLKAERDRLEKETFGAQGSEMDRLDREADWVQANLDCIASTGQNCGMLRELMAERDRERRLERERQGDGEAAGGGGGGGHSD